MSQGAEQQERTTTTSAMTGLLLMMTLLKSVQSVGEQVDVTRRSRALPPLCSGRPVTPAPTCHKTRRN